MEGERTMQYNGDIITVPNGIDTTTFITIVCVILAGCALYNLTMLIIAQIKLSKLKTAAYLIKKGHNKKLLAEKRTLKKADSNNKTKDKYDYKI